MTKAEEKPATHIHWIIWAYEAKIGDAENGYNYLDISTVDLVGTSEASVLARAKLLMPKKKGRVVHDVIEHLDAYPCK